MSLDQTKLEAPRDVLGNIPPLTVGIDEYKSIHQQRIPRKQSKRKQQRSANLHSSNVAEPSRKFSPKTDGFKHFLHCMRRLAMASPERTVAWNEIRNIYRKETDRHLNTDELNLISGTSGLTKKQLICTVLSSLVEPVDSKCLILRFILGSEAPTPSPVAGRSEEESGDISPVDPSETALADREAARQHIIEQLRLRGINIADREYASEATEQSVPSIAEEVEILEESVTEAELKPVPKDSLEYISSEVIVEVPEEVVISTEEETVNETQESVVERFAAGMECIAGDDEIVADEKEVMSDIDVSLNMSNIDDAVEPPTPQKTQEIPVTTEAEDIFVAEKKLVFDDNVHMQGDVELKIEETPVPAESAEVIVHQLEVCNTQEENSHVEHTIGTVSTQVVTESVSEELVATPPTVEKELEVIESQPAVVEKKLEVVNEHHDNTDSEDIPYDVTSNEQSRVNSPAEKPVLYTTTITVELEPKPQAAAPSTAHLDVVNANVVATERVVKELTASAPAESSVGKKQEEEETITPEVELEQRPMEVEQPYSSDVEKNGKQVSIVAPRKHYGRCCNIL